MQKETQHDEQSTKNGATPSVHGNGYHKDIPILGEQGPALDVERDILWDILPQAIVSQLKGWAGSTWSYIEGRTVIDQVNRIFGHGDLGHDLVGEVVLRETEAVDQKTWELKTRPGLHRHRQGQRRGRASAHRRGFRDVAEETVEGHDTAYKGAVTDALKRGLRSFGDEFGNSLCVDDVTTDTLASSLRRTLV